MNHEKVQMTEFEQSVYDLCPVLSIEEAKATASELLELAKKILLKTGKVVLASNYPEGCSFEDGFHLGYNEGFDACKKKVMKDAVDGRVFMSFAPGHNQMVMADVDLPTNTKVRIVVLKEEEK